jgi:Txe/YoeB family toxin of Txe-Axe toxin-antitoxin module
MNLVFNELSVYPLAENSNIAETNFRKLLNVFNHARAKYGFNHIQFQTNFSELKITSTCSFYEWISSLQDSTVKNLIIDLFKRPFVDDLEEPELSNFFEGNYCFIDDCVPIDIEPIGLPVSYIKNVPAISLDSHSFWNNRNITVRKLYPNPDNTVDFIAINICLESDLSKLEIDNWAKESFPIFIVTVELLKKYLGFTIYEPIFTYDFLTQFFDWRANDFATFKYLLLLMKDIQSHPFSGGMGQTENLIGRGKEASKRINNSYPNADRLSYQVENNKVKFIACKGHYDFH